MKATKDMRRKLLIDNLQYRLIAIGVIHFVAIVLIFAATIFVPIIVQLSGGNFESKEVQEAAEQFLVMHKRLWPPLFLAFILLTTHLVIISHRVSGPLVRIRAMLKSITKGDISRLVKLRQSDYLMREAAVINGMIDSLNKRIGSMIRSSDDANDTLVKLRRSTLGGSTADTARYVDELTTSLDDIRNVLDEFKTKATLEHANEPDNSADATPLSAPPVGAKT